MATTMTIIIDDCDVDGVDNVKWNRFLHERREAIDAIELLNLLAKKRGLSIEMTANDDAD